MIPLSLTLASAHAGSPDTGGCDLDGDGVDALFCGGTDCHDGDASVYPGAEEIAGDGIDQDCDGYDLSTGASWVGSGGSAVCGMVVGDGGGLVAALVAGLLVARRRR